MLGALVEAGGMGGPPDPPPGYMGGRIGPPIGPGIIGPIGPIGPIRLKYGMNILSCFMDHIKHMHKSIR